MAEDITIDDVRHGLEDYAGPYGDMLEGLLTMALADSGWQGPDPTMAHAYNCFTCGDRVTFGTPHECWVALKKFEQENLLPEPGR
jgi:hypothetical protein